MQEVLKKLQDSNEKQSKQILKLNESVVSIYKSVGNTEKSLDKLTKETAKGNKEAATAEKRRQADAKRKSADSPLARAIAKNELTQKKTAKTLGSILDGLGGIGEGLLGVIKAPAFGAALGAGLSGGLVAALAIPAVHENLGKAFVKALDWLDKDGVQKISSILNQVIDNVSSKIIKIGTDVANTMSDVFYNKILTPLGQWWSTVNVDFMGLKFGGAGVNPFPAAGSYQQQLQQQGNSAKGILNNNAAPVEQRAKAEKLDSLLRRNDQYNKNISQYQTQINQDHDKIKDLEDEIKGLQNNPLLIPYFRDLKIEELRNKIDERRKSISDRESWIKTNQQKARLLKEEFEEAQKLQTGGPIKVPGSGSGDTVPALLPPGSFVLNRNATNAFFQEGGKIPAMLEPGEMVFPRATSNLEMMNNSVPRFGNRKDNGAPSEDSVLPQIKGYQKGGKVFLHWAGSGYSGASPSYHATVQGDGSVAKTRDYNTFGGAHTSERNSEGIGLSLAAMAGASDSNFGKFPVKPVQYDAMAKLTADILQSWGHGPGYVSKSNVMTHAEAGTAGDSKGNYGPAADGGTGERWDLWKLFESDAGGTGGNKIRSMIKSHMKPPEDYDANKKYKTGDRVKWSDGSIRVFDGMGWDKPENMSTSVNRPGIRTSDLSTSTDDTKKENNIFQNFMGGMTGMMKDLPFIGDFMRGFQRGFNRGLDPNSPAAALQSFLFGGGGQSSTSNNNPFDIFGGGGFQPFGTDSSTPITGSVNEKLLQMAKLAQEAGFTNEQAKIMAAIAGGESTFNPKAHNPRGRDNSYGLWQINMLGKMGEERRRMLGIQSNEELFNPKVNARAAKMIFDRQGFNAWGAYTDGNAAKYMDQAQKLKLQQGGWIGSPNALLEPGESVFTPEMMNNAVPRFRTGGTVGMRGIGTSNEWIDSSMNQSGQQPIVIINNPPPQSGGVVSADPGAGTPQIPAMSSGPTSPLAGLLMTQSYLLADRIG